LEGFDPETEQGKKVAAARKTEAPFSKKHLENCGPKEGIILAVYPDDPEWDNWCGFTVVAKTSNSESLVRDVGNWLLAEGLCQPMEERTARRSESRS